MQLATAPVRDIVIGEHKTAIDIRSVLFDIGHFDRILANYNSNGRKVKLEISSMAILHREIKIASVARKLLISTIRLVKA